MPQNHRGLFFLAMNTSDCGYKVLALFNEKYEPWVGGRGGREWEGREEKGREGEGREGEGGGGKGRGGRGREGEGGEGEGREGEEGDLLEIH